MIYEIGICLEENRDKSKIDGCIGNDCSVDPPCATNIQPWLSKKRIALSVIDNQVNMAYGSNQIIQKQTKLNSIPIN